MQAEDYRQVRLMLCFLLARLTNRHAIGSDIGPECTDTCGGGGKQQAITRVPKFPALPKLRSQQVEFLKQQQEKLVC